MSLNALIRRLLEDVDRAERERELQSAYEVLGGTAESAEPYFEAQAEVARRG